MPPPGMFRLHLAAEIVKAAGFEYEFDEDEGDVDDGEDDDDFDSKSCCSHCQGP